MPERETGAPGGRILLSPGGLSRGGSAAARGLPASAACRASRPLDDPGLMPVSVRGSRYGTPAASGSSWPGFPPPALCAVVSDRFRRQDEGPRAACTCGRECQRHRQSRKTLSGGRSTVTRRVRSGGCSAPILLVLCLASAGCSRQRDRLDQETAAAAHASARGRRRGRSACPARVLCRSSRESRERWSCTEVAFIRPAELERPAGNGRIPGHLAGDHDMDTSAAGRQRQRSRLLAGQPVVLAGGQVADHARPSPGSSAAPPRRPPGGQPAGRAGRDRRSRSCPRRRRRSCRAGHARRAGPGPAGSRPGPGRRSRPGSPRPPMTVSPRSS